MPKTIRIIRADLLKHPAVKAWRGLRLGRGEPVSIEILKEGKKRAIYRLAGVGPKDSAIIAKRCQMITGLIERTVYEQVLPHLPVTAPRYYGFAEEEDTFCWLFLEDVGMERFSPLIEEHRVLAARWLGLMHTAAAHVATTARLPERGPDHYLEHLRSARRTILRNLTNPALNAAGVAVLKTIGSQCDALEAGWNQVEKCCESMPSTLVHGDFRPKNVYIRTTDQAGTGLFPIDWETAGWGVPAADLAPSHHRYSGQHVDLTTYWSIVREYWPSLDMSTIQQLVCVGFVFRRLAAISWASRDLAYEWTERPVEFMRKYQAELSEVMQAAQWTQ
jgi:hypothetical protein